MSDFKNQSPWGTPPGGGGSGNGGFRKGPTPPNIDEVISKLQSIINRFLGGGKGGAKVNNNWSYNSFNCFGL